MKNFRIGTGQRCCHRLSVTFPAPRQELPWQRSMQKQSEAWAKTLTPFLLNACAAKRATPILIARRRESGSVVPCQRGDYKGGDEQIISPLRNEFAAR